MRRWLRRWIVQHVTKRYPTLSGDNCARVAELEGACMLGLGHTGQCHPSMFAEPRS